jgi:hypothetical protein
MPIFIPTITTYVNGVVTVVSTDTTPYSTIIQSMGSFVYGVKEMYLKANSNSQILQSYQFSRYDVNGTLESYVDVPTIDPYQFQSSLFLKLTKDNVFLDGRTNLDFTLLPSETLYIILYTFILIWIISLNPSNIVGVLYFDLYTLYAIFGINCLLKLNALK